jgi:hypothetical protein
MPFKTLMWLRPAWRRRVRKTPFTAIGWFFPKIKEALHRNEQAFSLARLKVKAEP